MRLPSMVIRCASAVLLILGVAACGSRTEAEYQALWVSFISDTEGWSGGYWVNCLDCPTVVHTTDAGRSWEAAAKPPANLGTPVIADARNWFAVSGTRSGQTDVAELWSSHDAGISWARAELPTGVERHRWANLAIEDGTVQIPVFDTGTGEARIVSSPVDADHFTLSRPFPVGAADFVAGNRWRGVDAMRAGRFTWIGVTASVSETVNRAAGVRFANDEWTAWPIPCPGPMMAVSPTELVSSCTPASDADAFSGVHHLYASTDSGSTYTDVGPLTSKRTRAKLIAAASAKDLVILATTGDDAAPYAVRTSHDGGRTWATTLNPAGAQRPSAGPIGGFGEFFTPAVGFAALRYLMNSDTVHHFFLTRDGGDTWTPLDIQDSKSW